MKPFFQRFSFFLCAVFVMCICAHDSVALTLEGGADKTGVSSGTTTTKTPGPTTTDGGPGGPDLHMYLTDNGTGFNRCKYQNDHPGADTLLYGKPDHFSAGQPLGNTSSVNGNPAKYVRCAGDPCRAGGSVCWKNPAYRKPRTITEVIDDNLQTRGCKQDASGKIHCPTPKPPAGADASFYPKYTNQDNCHRTATGISCDTGSGGGHKPTTTTRKTAPGDPFENGTQHRPLSEFFNRDRSNDGNAKPRSNGGQLYDDKGEPKRYTPPPAEANDDGLYHGDIDPPRAKVPLPGAPGSYLQNTHAGTDQLHDDNAPGSYLNQGNGAPGSYIQQNGNR